MEIKLATARSDVPGGQHVNKVESKVMLRFNVVESMYLTKDEKEIILEKIKSQLTKDDVLIIIVESQK